jgi:hypothetical protein
MDDPEGQAHLFETMVRVCDACAELSPLDRLEVLQLAWLTLASNARTEASDKVSRDAPLELGVATAHG